MLPKTIGVEIALVLMGVLALPGWAELPRDREATACANYLVLAANTLEVTMDGQAVRRAWLDPIDTSKIDGGLAECRTALDSLCDEADWVRGRLRDLPTEAAVQSLFDGMVRGGTHALQERANGGSGEGVPFLMILAAFLDGHEKGKQVQAQTESIRANFSKRIDEYRDFVRHHLSACAAGGRQGLHPLVSRADFQEYLAAFADQSPSTMVQRLRALARKFDEFYLFHVGASWGASNPSQTRSCIESILASYPSFAPADTLTQCALLLSVIQIESGEFNGAIQSCDRILARTPNHCVAYNNRAMARLMTGDVERAEADLRSAWRLKEGDPWLCYSWARFFALGRRDSAQAMSWFREAVRRGFNRFDHVRSTRSLALIEGTQEFRELTALRALGNIVWGLVLDDLHVWNKSTFEWTNVKIDVKARHSGRTDSMTWSYVSWPTDADLNATSAFSINRPTFEWMEATITSDQGSATLRWDGPALK